MRSVLGLGLVVVLSIAVSAQLPTSALNGTVTDPQGAVVAGAKVSIVSQATGAVRDTTTDTAGFIRLPICCPRITRFALRLLRSLKPR
jgi:Carboxypeptidase regulatory-like domain